MAQVLKAIEMFNEMVQKGYIIPASEHHSLKDMSIYRTVPSVMTSGSGNVAGSYSAALPDAQLDSTPKGNSGD
jgi:hypothetical protein